MFSKLADISKALGHHVSLSEARECLSAAEKNRAKYLEEVARGDISYDAEEVFYLDHEVGLYQAVISDIRSFLF